MDKRLTALLISCTLKPSPEPSSTEVLGGMPDAVRSAVRVAATNAVHVARLLKQSPYPA